MVSTSVRFAKISATSSSRARVQQRQVQDRVQVTERDIDNYLATQAKQGGNNPEYRVGHILIAVPDGASPEQLAEPRRRPRTSWYA